MTNTQTKKVGTGYYVLAGLGFIPLLGVLFAGITIIIGLAKCRSGGVKLIILGCLGILFTVGLYGTLFYEGFVVRGGIYDELRADLAKTNLTDLVKNIEYYKVTKGQYPASLQQLQASFAKESFTTIYDPTSMPHLKDLGAKRPMATFFYKLIPDKTHYYLLGAGADGKPFTSDDLLPDISDQDRARTGLLINPASLPARK